MLIKHFKGATLDYHSSKQKMTKKILILLLLVFVLYGCKPDALTRLETPTNLRYENYEVHFDAVENAEMYILEVNGVTHELTDTMFELPMISTYDVRVKSRAEGYQDSYYTEMLNFTLEFDFVSPSNINLIDGILFWDPVPNALSYLINVDGLTYSTSDTSMQISLYSSIQKEIKIRSIYRLGVSDYSIPIYASSEITVLSSVTKNYSTLSTFDLEVKSFENNPSVISIRNIADELVDLSNILIANNKIFFKSSFLQTQLTGLHIYIIETNFGYHQVKINITNTDRPYMISGSEILTDFKEDVTIEFELFGGNVLSMSGNDISVYEYTISGNKVTIDKEFMVSQFIKVPSRTTLILGYTLESGDNVVIGYIFIKANQ